MVCLIKPQFEAGKDKVGKNGVVRDKKVHEEVVRNIIEFTNNSGFLVLNLDYSPIKGPKGNIEYLMHIRKDAEGDFDESIIENIVNLAHSELDKKEEAWKNFT